MAEEAQEAAKAAAKKAKKLKAKARKQQVRSEATEAAPSLQPQQNLEPVATLHQLALSGSSADGSVPDQDSDTTTGCQQLRLQHAIVPDSAVDTLAVHQTGSSGSRGDYPSPDLSHEATGQQPQPLHRTPYEQHGFIFAVDSAFAEQVLSSATAAADLADHDDIGLDLHANGSVAADDASRGADASFLEAVLLPHHQGT